MPKTIEQPQVEKKISSGPIKPIAPPPSSNTPIHVQPVIEKQEKVEAKDDDFGEFVNETPSPVGFGSKKKIEAMKKPLEEDEFGEYHQGANVKPVLPVAEMDIPDDDEDEFGQIVTPAPVQPDPKKPNTMSYLKPAMFELQLKSESNSDVNMHEDHREEKVSQDSRF